MQLTRLSVAVALVLSLAAGPLPAQEGLPTTPQVPDSVQALFQEYQTLAEEVKTVQDSALEANPELVEAQESVEEFVQSRMYEANPGLEQDAMRIDTLQQAAQQAQEEGDTIALQRIAQVGSRIQQQLQSAQAVVLQEEAVQERIQTVRERMVSAMTEIDPEIDETIVRMEELAQRLRQLQPGGG